MKLYYFYYNFYIEYHNYYINVKTNLMIMNN